MINLVMFVLACLAWQRLKDWYRGPRLPEYTVKMRGRGASAKCGCRIEDTKVSEPCQAHGLMSRIQGE